MSDEPGFREDVQLTRRPQAVTPDAQKLAVQLLKEQFSGILFYANWTDLQWERKASSQACALVIRAPR